MTSIPKKSILIIEDDAIQRSLLFHTLKILGCEILQAENGMEARALYATHQEKITLVISDINLPHENGFQVFESLLLLNKEVRVLFISGSEDNSIKNKLIEMGAVGMLKKPVSISLLSATVKQYL
jgi:two-component system, cell cycle sensor histidine kinase and response regulator CckA